MSQDDQHLHHEMRHLALESIKRGQRRMYVNQEDLLYLINRLEAAELVCREAVHQREILLLGHHALNGWGVLSLERWHKTRDKAAFINTLEMRRRL